MSWLYKKYMYPSLERYSRKDPEKAHDWAREKARAYRNLRFLMPVNMLRRSLPRLDTWLHGLHLKTPYGSGAGVDKYGDFFEIFDDCGMSFQTFGSVTRERVDGNPRPRIWRFSDGMGNAMGLPNLGIDASEKVLEARRPGVPLIGNVAQTPREGMSVDEAIADFKETAIRLQPHVNAIEVNGSCPNTSEGKTFTDPMLAGWLISELRSVIDLPLFYKASPDQTAEEYDELIDTLEEKIDGWTISNTTTNKFLLRLKDQKLYVKGGISGPPVFDLSTAVLGYFYRRTNNPIIGVGGVDNGHAAWQKHLAGATAVQCVTGLFTEGPTLPRECAVYVDRKLKEKNDCLSRVIGTEAYKWEDKFIEYSKMKIRAS